MNNAIDIYLSVNDLESAQLYLDYLNRFLKEYPSIQHSGLAVYYENLIAYQKTKKYKYVSEIKKLIFCHESLRDFTTAKSLDEEIDDVISGKNLKPEKLEVGVFTE